MTVAITLPADVEARLNAEVRAGRHPSLEAAILERLSHTEDLNLLALTGLSPDELRADLNDAWNDRHDARDGEAVFARLAAKRLKSK